MCVVHIYCCNLGIFKTLFPYGHLQKAPAHQGFTVEVEPDSLGFPWHLKNTPQTHLCLTVK